jgi:two-component system, NtrC family, sensor kinase
MPDSILDVSTLRLISPQSCSWQRILHTLWQHHAVNLFVLDVLDGGTDYRYSAFNPALAKSSPIPVENLLGQTVREALPPEVAALCLQQYGHVVASGQPVSFEHSLIGAAQATWWRLDVMPVDDESKSVQHLVVTVTDVTERKRRENRPIDDQALQARATNIESLMANSLGTIYRCQYDEEHTMLYISEGIQDLSGYPASDFIQNHQCSLKHIIHPDDRDQVNTTIEQALKHRRSYHIEFRICRADSTIAWVHNQGQGIFDPAGNLCYIDGAMLDISDRKQAEFALHESKQLLQLVMDNIPQLIFWKDQHSVYRGCNQKFAELAGYEHPEQLIGKTDYDMPWAATEAAMFIERDRQVLKSNVPLYHLLETQHLADGRQIWADTNKIPLHDTHGNIIGILGTYEDITERKTFEEALHQSQGRLKRLIQHIPIPVIEWNAQLEITEWNPAAEKTFGYRRSEVLGKNLELLLPETERASVQQIIDELLTKPESNHTINQNLTQSGQLITCEWFNKPLCSASGKFLGAVSMAMDVTDRKVAEAALADSEAKFRGIVENANDMFFIINPAGEFNYVSPQVSDLLGYTIAEFQNQPFGQFVHPDDLQICTDAAYEIFSTGRKKLGVDDYRVRHKDGSWRWHVANTAPLLGQTGEIVALLGVARDITDRKLAEQQLQDYADRQSLLNRLANQIRQSLDLNTVIATTVQETCELMHADYTLFGWLRPEMNPQQWEFVAQHSQADVPDFLGCYPEGSAQMTAHLVAQNMLCFNQLAEVEDITYRQFLSQLGVKSQVIIPLKTQLGQVGIFICSHVHQHRQWQPSEVELLQAVVNQLAIAIDQAALYTQTQAKSRELAQTLQELQRTQAQMVQAEKMSSLGQLVAGIAHEINNPVNFIHGNLDYVNEYVHDLINLVNLYTQTYPQPTAAIATEISRIDLSFVQLDLANLLSSMELGTTRIQDIVKSLRIFSRLDEAEVKAVDIHESLDSTLMILDHRFKATEAHPAIQIHKDYGSLPPIECYAGQLNQVFMHLLTNSIDALRQGNNPHPQPTITLTTQLQCHPNDRGEAGTLVLQIADNGCGMAPSVQQRIFDPFFTTKAVGRGTGLGLSVSYQIVTEKHHGRLTCQSELGQGTSFTITIPVQQRTS